MRHDVLESEVDWSILKRGRIDFHLHSYASNVTDYYTSNSLSIPESYSDPIETYHLLKSRGMDLVTLTDHNSIDGVRALLDAGFDDVFVSAEMTTSFPEDGCRIHVTVANVSETEYAEIDRLRPNVYEMVAYLDGLIASESGRVDERRIAYFMTHPLMSTQNRPYGRDGSLSVWHLERAMLLFDCLEVHNGTRAAASNALTRRLLASLDRKKIEELAAKHDLAPKGATPWLKAVVGGSDDHSGINPGRAWTVFRYLGDRPRPNDVVDSIRRRTTSAEGMHGGPVTLAHALVKLVYDSQHSRHRAASAKPIRMSDPVNMLLEFAFGGRTSSTRSKLALRTRVALDAMLGPIRRSLGRPESFDRIFLDEARGLLSEASFRARIVATESTDDKIFLIISTLLDRLCVRYVTRIRENSSGDLVRTLKEAIALVSSNLLVSLPYFVTHAHHGGDKALTRDVRKAFDLDEAEKLVLVTDTLFDVNGVALTIRKLIRTAEERGVDLTVVTCLSREARDEKVRDPEIADLVTRGKLVVFPAIVSIDLPEYSELQLRLMPFLEFLRFIQERGFTKMQISTPGPVGAMGLLAARLVGIEASSTYHTSFPEYVEEYTKDVSLEALTWKLVILFYHSVDEVVVPSRFIAQLLHKRGLRNRKLLVLDRWVDLNRFHPIHRTPGFWARFGMEREDELVKFVYVGRLGAEKGLDLLAEAFRQLYLETQDVHLAFVGDGPYRATLEGLLDGLPVTFTGFLGGSDLPRALASADVKVFPSTTDTWGNAPLEAQASGIPVIVSDKGGPQELMEPGVTGLRVKGGDAKALLDAMRELLDPARRTRMAREARIFVEANDVKEPYSAILDSTAYRRRRKSEKLLSELLLHNDDPSGSAVDA
ncbi:MAG: glycosyltransferase [Myxococcota bacterium]